MNGRSFVINATSVGRSLTGLGRYGVVFGRFLLEHWNFPFEFVVNGLALHHFKDLANGKRIRVASERLSPDFGFSGAALRVVGANTLGLWSKRSVLFALSPLEACVFHPRQIVTVHDLIPTLFPGEHRKVTARYYRTVVPGILRKAVRIIAVSHTTQDLLLRTFDLPRERVSVIYNAISDAFQPANVATEKGSYALFVGRDAPTKNLARLLQAFAMLRHRSDLGLTLKVTGVGRRVFSRGDLEGVEILGHVSDERLVTLYRHAIFCVIPSLCEGFGFPALEAMACGCPVVAANAGSLPEVCGDAAFYVDPSDLESIVHGMRAVGTTRPLREALIDRGLRRARTYSVEASGGAYVRLFEEILSEGCPP